MIYLDNAATTKMSKKAMETYIEYNEKYFYNPSSPHKAGFDTSLQLQAMRDKVKKLLHIGSEDKVFFCSCATEANNTILRSNAKKDVKFVVSSGEHPSVLNVCKDLQSKGVTIFYLSLNKDGTANLEELEQIVNNNKIDFVSIMNASNETGAINDIKKVVEIAKRANPKCLVHSDGVQAVGKIDVNIKNLGVDYYTMSGHKFHGPKGVGAYYVGKNAIIKPLLLGGGQENGVRSGTENLPAIASMVTALEEVVDNQKQNYALIDSFKQYILDYFKNDNSIIFNTTDKNSPYVLSMSINGLKGEVLVHFLEQYDILLGTGSACSSKKAGNNTLLAMGRSKEEIIGSIRMSFSIYNTMEEIKFLCEKLKEIIDRQREIN